jgi:hypothetical protein
MKKSYALTLVAASITSLVLQGFATAGPIKSTATLTQAGLYEPTSIYNGLQATTDNNIGWTHSPVASGGGADDLTGLGFWNGASIYMTWSGIQTITGVDLTSYGPLKPGVGSTPYVDPDRIAILGLKDGGTVGNNADYTEVLYAPGSFSWTGPSSNYSGGQVFSVSGLNVSTTSLRIVFASSLGAWSQLGEVDVYGAPQDLSSTATLTQAGLAYPTGLNGLLATTDNKIGWENSPIASGGGTDDLTGLGFWNGASIYMTWSGIQTITGVDLTSYGPLKPGVGSTPYVDPDRIAILGLKDGGTVGNNDDYTKVLYAPGSFSWTGPSSNYSGGQVFSVSGLNVSTTSLRIAFASSVPAWNQLGEVDVYGSAAAPAPTYASWAAENAGNQTAELDWDNDGVPNGVEFFMGSASGFTANPGLDGSNKVTWTNGGNIPSSAYGTQFVVQTSTDLTTWEDVLVQDLESNDGSLSYILNGSEKQFVRLKVTP